MALDRATIEACGDELFACLRERRTVAPLSARMPGITIDDAYHVSRRLLERRLQDGERVIGKKIGVTSKAVQQMLDVHQPDFGWLTDRMIVADGEIPMSTAMIQPKAEGEIAFLLKADLLGPGVTNAAVLRATECVMPCFEVVDSRIVDWKIRIQDTVADNASCGVFVLGEARRPPTEVDLQTCGIAVWKNGALLSTGAGAAALGSPLNAVAWLANTLGAFGIGLQRGDIVLSGSLVPLETIAPGDEMSLRIGGLGSCSLRVT